MDSIFEKIKRSLEFKAVEFTAYEIDKLKSVHDRSIDLLMSCKAQVGMSLGEEIEEHLSISKGTHFNPKDYHYERMPEGQ